ncbi:hypothetical protein NC652_024185 [Populus alba x Populus x berolinensis]|nr:hypothetical protein NC652_024185 [Populus alba x Populus x berolinensis]
MALVPTVPPSESPLFAEVDVDSDSSAPTVRTTLVQATTVFYDTPATLHKAERLLAEAAGFGSQLVVFPEAFIGGYSRGSSFGAAIGSRTAKGREDFRKKHRKVLPTAVERIVWGFGDGSTIPVGKIGAAICWENRMPLLRTAMFGKGIEIYCAPAADSRDTWEATMTHVALEGGCFVPSANQFCRRKDYPPPPFAIISPSGTVLAGPNCDGEALISADLDLGEIARAKFDFDVVGHYSRPEVLSLTVRDHPTNAVLFTSVSAKTEGR